MADSLKITVDPVVQDGQWVIFVLKNYEDRGFICTFIQATATVKDHQGKGDVITRRSIVAQEQQSFALNSIYNANDARGATGATDMNISLINIFSVFSVLCVFCVYFFYNLFMNSFFWLVNIIYLDTFYDT